MSGSCPHAVVIPGIVSAKGCKLTEFKARWDKENIHKTNYQLCSPSCYEGDYTKCPYYRDWMGLTK